MMKSEDRGFTLVELLVAIVILGIIIGALGTAIMVTFRTTDEANDRLALAHDMQISTAAFASDVQSADEIVVGDASPPCGPSPASLSLVWMDGSIRNVASYSLNGTSLSRVHCIGGDVRSQKLSSHVFSVATPACSDPDGAGVGCTPTGPAVRTVSWVVSQCGEIRGCTEGQSHTLTGTRRVG